MSAEENRCSVPKINTYQYKALLIHNPSNLIDK